MLQFDHEQGARLCDGISRRAWLQLGTLGAVGFSLPQFFAAKARGNDTAGASGATKKATAKACIQIYLVGGPGQHETWDMKPEAPVGVRGDFRPIDTNLPGF